MCNAWNHAPSCQCGWGGEGYAGRRGVGLQTNPALYSDFCRPTHCSMCGKPIYFIRHNGGSIWVDELGVPWPKHSCYKQEENKKKYFDWYNALALVIQKPVLGLSLGNLAILNNENNTCKRKSILVIKSEYDIYYGIQPTLQDAPTKIVDWNGAVIIFSLTSMQIFQPYLDKPVAIASFDVLTKPQKRDAKLQVLNKEYQSCVKIRTALAKKWVSASACFKTYKTYVEEYGEIDGERMYIRSMKSNPPKQENLSLIEAQQQEIDDRRLRIMDEKWLL